MLLSDVDALYDGPPAIAGSSPVAEVRKPADLADFTIGGAGTSVGSGGMRTKVQAAQIATDAGMPVVLTSIENAAAALAGEQVGTLFYPSGRRRPSRLLWLQHGSDVQGQVVLDDGAVRADPTQCVVAASRDCQRQWFVRRG